MMRKIHLLTIFLFLVALMSVKQSAVAQNVVADSLIAKLNDFRSKNFTEKIFLHTDRSSYFTGEDIWFGIYHVDGSFHKSIDWSKVLYVELIGSDGKAVVQGKFPLGDTTTTGSLYLPASLSSGNYDLVAYTSWMKNSDSENFFHQSIRIINPFVELSKEQESGQEYDVQFFPEGGNLIYGLENTLAFRAVGRDGKGIMFRGAILNQLQDTIVRFSPLKFGLGRVNFLPQRGDIYSVVMIDAKKKTFTHPLPKIENDGYALQAVELDTKIKISVQTTWKETHSVFLLIHTRQTKPYVEQIFMKDGEGVAMIDKKKLSEGVSYFTIFTNELVPVCERLWFKKPQHSLNFVTELNQSNFSTRQKAELNIVSEIGTSPAELSNITVVVYKPDSLDLPVNNIVSYINLTSELKGNIEQSEYYFGTESIERAEASNNLMLTHGWRKLNWKDVLQRNYTMKYFPELNGHMITGQITDGVQPVSRMASYLTFAGLPINVYISRTDSLGMVNFETQPGFGKKNLIVQADGRTGKAYHVTLQDPFYQEQLAYRKSKFSLLPGMKAALEQRSIHMQVNTLFHPKKQSEIKTSSNSSFYGKADEQYLLDDYTRFPTLEEVMREYVPGVRVSKLRGRFELKNLDMVNKQPFRQNPLVLVDGVPVFDMNVLMEIDPLKIKKLDVVTRRYYLQAGSYDGIVSLMSYKNDLGGFQPPVEALLTSYSCFEEKREFFNPIYQTEKQTQGTTPDVRYVLYRSPDNLAASGSKLKLSFYTSDISGTYNVVVQGITKEGLPGYSQTAFEVK